MRRGVDVLWVDIAARQREAQGVVDGALAALRNRKSFIGPNEASQDRKSGGVGRSVAERAERVRVHVPDGFLGCVPLIICMGQLHAAGIWEERPVGGPGDAE